MDAKNTNDDKHVVDMTKTGRAISLLNLSIPSTIPETGGSLLVRMFASFDIVGSTLMKQIDLKWKNVFRKLLGISNASNTPPTKGIFGTNLQPWKAIGDELIYCGRIQYVEELVLYIDRIREHLQKLQNELSKAVDRAGAKIFVKSAVWIALTSDSVGIMDSQYNGNHVNFEVNHDFSSNNSYMLDFAGVDIDEGFRVAAQSTPQQIIIDPKIAYILYAINKQANFEDPSLLIAMFGESNDDYAAFITGLDGGDPRRSEKVNEFKQAIQDCVNKLKFIEYVSPKSVWLDKPYPVIWYEYDSRTTPYYRKPSFEPIDVVPAIYDQVGNANVVYNIVRNLRLAHHGSIPIEREVSKVLQVYFMTACHDTTKRQCNKDENISYYNNIIVFKRSPNCKHYPGFWDFGNYKYDISQTPATLPDRLEKEYQDYFGLKIKLEQSTTNTVLPHDHCEIIRGNSIRMGILCKANVESFINHNGTACSHTPNDTGLKYCNAGRLVMKNGKVFVELFQTATGEEGMIELEVIDSLEKALEIDNEIKENILREQTDNSDDPARAAYATIEHRNYILVNFVKWATAFTSNN